jgi:CheY-like chemotaxis protein
VRSLGLWARHLVWQREIARGVSEAAASRTPERSYGGVQNGRAFYSQGHLDDKDAARTSRIVKIDFPADMLATLLTFGGHETHTAHDGVAAVEAVHRLNRDVVVLDIGLPVLNGYDAARRIRAGNGGSGRPFLIALTGWGQDEDRTRSQGSRFRCASRQAGGRGYRHYAVGRTRSRQPGSGTLGSAIENAEITNQFSR